MNTVEKIRKIVDGHLLMRIATVNEENFPKVRSVDFAADEEKESILYFMTFKNTDKTKEIANNNNVHIVIDKDAESMEELGKILYLKATGKAYPVESQDEIQKAMGLIMQKYPYLSNLPGDPSMMALYRVELGKVTVTDNGVSFGHNEVHSYCSSCCCG